MLTIYGIKNCDTMKKAFAELEALGVEYVFHDYKKSGIDAASLKGWIKAKGLETVLNRRGTSWRKLTEAEQAQAATEAGAVALMQANTSLIKRPVLQDAKLLLIGFSADEYRQALS